MPTVDVSAKTYRDLQLLKVGGERLTDNEIIAQLIDLAIASDNLKAGGVTENVESLAPVHAIYMANRVDGQYDPSTKALTITSGELEGQSYNRPSSAARAVVRNINPNLTHDNRNGWSFWIVTSTGDPLQSLRSQ